MNADKALELARLAYPNDKNLRIAYMLGLTAGANWQKAQDLAEMAQSKSPLSVAYANRCFENGKQAMKEQMPMPEDTVLFNKGVAEGKRLMMEDAIKCYVYESENPCSESLDECLHSFSVLYSYKGKQPYPLAGQYIKLIIVEEEDEK